MAEVVEDTKGVTDKCPFCPKDKPCNEPWCPYTKDKDKK